VTHSFDALVTHPNIYDAGVRIRDSFSIQIRDSFFRRTGRNSNFMGVWDSLSCEFVTLSFDALVTHPNIYDTSMRICDSFYIQICDSLFRRTGRDSFYGNLGLTFMRIRDSFFRRTRDSSKHL